MRTRVIASVSVLLAWLAGLGMLVRREYFRPNIERLAEAALRVTPGAVFYAVLQGGEGGDRQVGFASSTIDTSTATIEQRDYLVADLPVGGKAHRITARTTVVLSRMLRLKTFEVSFEADGAATRVAGEVVGDTVLQFAAEGVDGARPDTQRVKLAGPILLPTLVPLAVALEEKPSVGKTYVLPLFDAASLAPKEVRLEIQAESLFVVNDSSVFDSTSGLWHGVLPDTVRAWQIVSSGPGLGGWVDAQGRLVATSRFGFRLQRRPYEVAFENWRRVADTTPATSASRNTVPRDRDIVETTAIAANKRLRSGLSEVRVLLGGVPLSGFDLDGGRQSLGGDTLTVRRETVAALAPRYFTIPAAERKRPELKPEPFLEAGHREIVALADRIADGSRDPRLVAERINKWVYDSLKKEVSLGIPSALHVLHTRAGDCNEHTQLFVALARAAGIPARVAAGLAYVDGKFYYHAWPEVMLRGWVAVDPTFGQFPADAGHLRFVVGGLGRQAELLRLLGGLTIKVVDAR